MRRRRRNTNPNDKENAILFKFMRILTQKLGITLVAKQVLEAWPTWFGDVQEGDTTGFEAETDYMQAPNFPRITKVIFQTPNQHPQGLFLELEGPEDLSKLQEALNQELWAASRGYFADGG